MKVTYINHMGDDLSVVNAARVSFGKKSDWDAAYYAGNPKRLRARDERLIKYLAKHKHTSPFNHTYITMHVKAPIFVARQLVKHKFMPWNEVSRRYVDDEPELYWPEKLREAPEGSVKQGSGGDHPLWNHGVGTGYYGDLKEQMGDVVGTYNNLIDAGVAPEQARMVLPQNTYTEWYWSGTLGAWADMYKLRIDPHAQKETQEVARQAGEILSKLYPISWKELTQ